MSLKLVKCIFFTFETIKVVHAKKKNKIKTKTSFPNLETLFTVQVSDMQSFLKISKQKISKTKKKNAYYFI